jgi:hypothetical protein
VCKHTLLLQNVTKLIVETGFYTVHPPTHSCLDVNCQQALGAGENQLHDCELVEELKYMVTVFTKNYEAVPGFTTFSYCRSKCL